MADGPLSSRNVQGRRGTGARGTRCSFGNHKPASCLPAISTTLELFDPAFLHLAPRDNREAQAPGLHFEAVPFFFLPPRRRTHLVQRCVPSNFEYPLTTSGRIYSEIARRVRFPCRVKCRGWRSGREHRIEVVAERCVLVELRDDIRYAMLRVEEPDREYECLPCAVLWIEVRPVRLLGGCRRNGNDIAFLYGHAPSDRSARSRCPP